MQEQSAFGTVVRILAGSARTVPIGNSKIFPIKEQSALLKIHYILCMIMYNMHKMYNSIWIFFTSFNKKLKKT